MRRFILYLVAFCSFAAHAQAQAVQAKSGEHSTFSRIVFEYDAEDTWDIQVTDNGATLVFSDQKLVVDVSRVLRFLPRRRLLAIEARAGEIEFTFSCRCALSAFQFDDAFLVVDLTDDLSVPPRPQPQPQVQLPLQSSNWVATEFARVELAQESDVVEGPAVSRRLDEASISKSIADSIAMGFLTQSRVMPTSDPQNTAQDLQDPQLRSFNAFEIGRRQTDVKHDDKCELPEALDISDWPPRADVLRGLGALRRNLISPAGIVDQDAVLPVAKAYLILGFGAEARSVLREIPSVEDRILDATYIVDQDPLPSNESFSDVYSCGNDLAFWAILSSASIRRPERVNTAAVQKTVLEMLPEQREMYLDTLVKRLRGADLSDAVIAISQIWRRSLNATEQLAESQTGIRDPDVPTRLAALTSEAFEGGVASGSALLEIFQFHADVGTAVPENILEFADAFVSTIDNDAVRVALEKALILGKIRSGRHFESIGILSKMDSRRSELVEDWLDPVLSEGLAALSDDAFILFVGRLRTAFESYEISSDTGLEVATRLSKLGFANEASKVVQWAKAEQSDRARLMAARARVSVGQASAALTELGGLLGDEAERIRADALILQNEFAAAGELISEEESSATTIAWLGQSEQGQDLLDPTRKALKEASLADTAPTFDPPLAQSEQSIQKSAELREIVSQVLALE